jgi:hypothetical protein
MAGSLSIAPMISRQSRLYDSPKVWLCTPEDGDRRPRRVRPTCEASAVLKCEECGCRSESGKGWFGRIAEDSEGGEGPVVRTYCPPCAERELDARPRVTHYV